MNAEGLAIVQIGGNARGGHRPVDHSPRSTLGTDARGYHPPVTRRAASGGARMCRRASIATVRRDLPDHPG